MISCLANVPRQYKNNGCNMFGSTRSGALGGPNNVGYRAPFLMYNGAGGNTKNFGPPPRYAPSFYLPEPPDLKKVARNGPETWLSGAQVIQRPGRGRNRAAWGSAARLVDPGNLIYMGGGTPTDQQMFVYQPLPVRFVEKERTPAAGYAGFGKKRKKKKKKAVKKKAKRRSSANYGRATPAPSAKKKKTGKKTWKVGNGKSLVTYDPKKRTVTVTSK